MTDIKYGTPTNHIVTGFFTPDYEKVASDFSDNLAAHGVPHHLFAAHENGEWGEVIMQKPKWVLEAAKLYPDTTLILMDVDCEVRGSLNPLVSSIYGDVALPVRLRVNPRRQGKVLFSARVIVVRPTEAALRLMEAWHAACLEPHKPLFAPMSCERELIVAMASNHGASVQFLPEKYSALEHHKAPEDALIVHHSEHTRRNRPSTLGKFGQSLIYLARGKMAA